MEIRKPQDIFLFPLLLLFLLGLPRIGFTAEQDDETISSVKYLCAAPIFRKDLEDLTGFRAGASFSSRNLDQAIKLLYLTRKFYRVSAESTRGPDGLELEFYLVPRRMIGEIKIKGLHSIRAGDVKKILEQDGIRPGLEYSEPSLSRVKKLLENYFQQAGFPLVELDIQGRFAPGDLGVTLMVKVNEGPPARIQAIEFSGDPYFPAERVRRELKLREGDRLDFRHVKERIKFLGQWYRRQGMWEVKIGEPEISPGTIPLMAVVRIGIQAGRRIRVDFSGTDLPEEEMRDLVRITRLQEDEEFSLAWIEEKAREIQDIYRRRGRLFIEAKTIPEDLSQRELVYHFQVDKGPTIHIRRIEFTGNRQVGSNLLKKQMLTNTRDLLGHIYERNNGIFREEVWEEDQQAIIFLYHKLGFAFARITGMEQEIRRPMTKDEAGDLVLQIGIEEGPRTRVGELVFTGNQALSNEKINRQVAIRIEDYLDPTRVEEGRKKIMEWYALNGFPLARVETRVDFSSDRGRASVSFLIDEGLRVHLNQIIVSGTRWTHDYVIQREFHLRKGEPYSLEKIIEGRRRLFNLGFLKEAQTELPRKDSSREDWDLLARVREEKGGFVEMGGGYATEEGLSVFTGIQHQNLWGTGRGALARAEVKFGELDRPQDLINPDLYRVTNWRFDTGYREPWIFNYNLLGRLDFNFEFRRRGSDATVENHDLYHPVWSAGLEREFRKDLKGTIRYEVKYYRRKYLSTSTGDREPAAEWLGIINPILVWDRRDDIFNPTRGLLVTSKLDYSHPGLASDRSYLIADEVGGVYQKLIGRLIGAFILRIGWGAGLGKNQDIPFEERFYLGGANSVRGFLQDMIGPGKDDEDGNFIPAGGKILLNYQAEIRFPFPGSQKLGGVIFSDGGGLWDDQDTINLGDFRKTAGLGLRYYTPIGPIRFDWGFKLDRKSGEALYQYYLAVGNPF